MSRKINAREALTLIQTQQFQVLRGAHASDHFTWGELLIYRTPVELASIRQHHLENLEALAAKLEDVRNLLGNRPIQITSGWRDTVTNQRVGGAFASRHLTGQAADIVVSGLSAQDVQFRLKDSWAGGLGYGATFTHLDIRGYVARFNY
jgi:hypothetical protein